MLTRLLMKLINKHLSQGHSLLLLGPRQTGKTTLINQITADLSISLIQPRIRLRYEQNPSLLSDEIEAIAETQAQPPLIIIDEVQKVPLIMDVAQDLIDRKKAQFILTGSSARKLKRNSDINLLPGRVFPLFMTPLSLAELPNNCNLLDLLRYGSLPQIYLEKSHEQKEALLKAYVSLYLEEEIRAEAIVRNVGHFSQFLALAASEAGKPVNYSKLSQDIGVSHSTIANYYQIGEDCLVFERIDPFLRDNQARRRLQRSQKYLWFDLGVRRIAAYEGVTLSREVMGHLFEQFIGLELLRYCHVQQGLGQLFYWRDMNGPEVDWVVQLPDQLIPVEVKLTDKPKTNDAKHLNVFLEEYPMAKKGYIICQVPRKMKITSMIYAIPWQDLLTIMA